VPRLSILVTSFAHRSFANWEPMLRRLSDRGHDINTAFFPRVSDPDHIGLSGVGFNNIGTWEIDNHFELVNVAEALVLAQIGNWITWAKPDLIWLCTFHGGPEGNIYKRVMELNLPARPIIVGLQHGMAQDWAVFERCTDRFDVLGTFGQMFIEQCSPEFRQRMVVMGLPKLDQIAHNSRYGSPISRILFAAQQEPSVNEAHLLLSGLAARLGATVLIRPHPEHRAAFLPLSPRFFVTSPDIPLENILNSVDAMVTTGSTAALEGLVAGLPVAVLPLQRGEAFAERALSPKA